MPACNETLADIKALTVFHQYERALAYCKQTGAGYKKAFRALKEKNDFTDITLKGLRGRLDPKGVSNGYEEVPLLEIEAPPTVVVATFT